MPGQLNHTIVHSTDKDRSARFLCEMLGLPDPKPFGHFLVVQTANGVSLDYISTDQEFTRTHYAFLISEDEFDQVWGRIKEKGLTYWADPRGQHENEINHHDGGRGLYFRDPDEHYMEIITRPYGGI